jgi:hypothetical protein
VVGSGLWALNTQLGQILPYAECGARISPGLLVSLLALAVTLLATLVSGRSLLLARQQAAGGLGFTAALGLLSGLLFAYALLLQGLSTVVLTGCER